MLVVTPVVLRGVLPVVLRVIRPGGRRRVPQQHQAAGADGHHDNWQESSHSLNLQIMDIFGQRPSGARNVN
jgi:hypothetical protein